MPGKLLMLAPLLLLLTACRQEQLLPVAHAAGQDDFRSSEPPPPPVQQARAVEPESFLPPPTSHTAKKTPHSGLHDSCYAIMSQRPQSQRARAVQARLDKADAIETAFSAQTVDVDLLGDHANILAVQFPVMWPNTAYATRVSSVMLDYFSATETLDYMCNAGFAQVRLIARGLNDGRMHVLWTGHVTAIGLVTDKNSPASLPKGEVTEQARSTEAASYSKPD
jgi:hypothetical protein